MMNIIIKRTKKTSSHWQTLRQAHTSSADSIALISKIVLTSPKPILEQTLTQSNVALTPHSAEQVLARLDNAGILAYRFFQWAHSHPHRHHKTPFIHTVKSYHFTISSLAKIRQYGLMWDLVADMKRRSLLNSETFAIIMRKYARAQKLDEALYTFSVMDKYGVPPDLSSFNSLLSALCKAKNVRKAQEVFDEMSHRFEPDSKTYSILLQGWGLAPNLPRMFQVFDTMAERGCEADVVTYSIMVDSLCKAGRVERAVEVVREMKSRGCPPTSFIYSVLVHTYGVEKRIEDAVEAFLEMERDGIVADVAVYNALVSAFCKVDRFENAYRVLGEMESKGVCPNSRTCNIILNGLIGLGRNDEAYRFFRWMTKVCEPDSDTYTMMIKMFFESDRSEMAMKVWKYMGKKQFVPSMHTFSVLINGLCEKGEVDKACVFLEEMIEKGIRPPGTTFGRLRKLLLEEHREDVLRFLEEKMKVLVMEPLCE